MLTKTLAREAAPFGVRVVSLSHCEVRAGWNLADGRNPSGQEGTRIKSPLERIGEIEEIARLATFLASDDAAYLSGGTVYADGARTNYPEWSHGSHPSH